MGKNIEGFRHPGRMGGCRDCLMELLDYPHTSQNIGLYPAEFILEGKDQIRGWFNLLMVCSMLAFGKPSFKSVYMHGFVQDSLGRKMSKSLEIIYCPRKS